jgi:hypothetical protein
MDRFLLLRRILFRIGIRYWGLRLGKYSRSEKKAQRGENK